MARSEFLIVGMGRFGRSLASKLLELGHTVLAVDCDSQVVQEVSSQIPEVVALDATEEAALREIGSEYFKTAVVAIGDDFESSVLATSLLKNLGIGQVVCKALSFRQRQILLKVGADVVILPEHDAGVRLATELSASGRVLEQVDLQPGSSVRELPCPARLQGRTLAQIDLPRQLGLTVVAARGVRGPDEKLETGDRLILIGNDKDLARFESWNG